MPFNPLLLLRIIATTCALSGLLWLPLAQAEEAVEAPPAVESKGFVERATTSIQDTLDQAVELLGIPYRRGGSKPETGFDCSGFVTHVFAQGIGLILPRSAKEQSKSGEKVLREELKPGDLVFFNTMRRTFSHVGIYLGHDQFVHAPRTGAEVRIEDMRDKYWKKRYNGARRIAP
jgi:cell wall-associated NlpC family hydrolase